jgi:hypothetical protein
MITEHAVRQCVREHQVCWEVAPINEMRGHDRIQVGYELRLFARHAARNTSPGSMAARTLHEKMSAVAAFVAPSECRPSRCEIAPFDASFHMRPESQWQPEVQLTVRIIHEEGYLRAIDACETRCAREIAARLHGLGAQEKAWHATPA